jgi:peptide-methionine (S)-S-oxide reductase
MFSFMKARSPRMPTREESLPGRAQRMPVAPAHTVLGTPMDGPIPEGAEWALFGMGCFWGAERRLWKLPGVHSTAVGYSSGFTPNATYEEVCSGLTGHNEVVRVVFFPQKLSFEALLKSFWEGHDPTTPNRQGNDVGTQYRSGIYCSTSAQRALAERSRESYQRALTAAGKGTICTEILDAGEFFFAEDYHQQYLDKNPGGYCGLGGTGVACPVGLLEER